MSFETLSTTMSSSEFNRTNTLKAPLFSKNTNYSLEEPDTIQEIIDINKENYYQELYSMDIFRYMEHSGYKDLLDIPETDYKYLGVNKQILLQLQEWNNWFENFLEYEKDIGSKVFNPSETEEPKRTNIESKNEMKYSPKEPVFPTLLPRVLYVKKQLVPTETSSTHKIVFRV